MTDHLSTIRQALEAPATTKPANRRELHIAALAACDALEAELDILKLGRDGISPEDYDRLIARCDALEADREQMHWEQGQALKLIAEYEAERLTLLDAADAVVPYMDRNEVIPERERAALVNALYLFDRAKLERIAG